MESVVETAAFGGVTDGPGGEVLLWTYTRYVGRIPMERLRFVPEPERNFRMLICKLQDLPNWEVFQRDIELTPYLGAYGTAGWVCAVNGSPPRGTVVVPISYQGQVIFVRSGGGARRLGSAQANVVTTFLDSVGATSLDGHNAEPIRIPARVDLRKQ